METPQVDCAQVGDAGKTVAWQKDVV